MRLLKRLRLLKSFRYDISMNTNITKAVYTFITFAESGLFYFNNVGYFHYTWF